MAGSGGITLILRIEPHYGLLYLGLVPFCLRQKVFSADALSKLYLDLGQIGTSNTYLLNV